MMRDDDLPSLEKLGEKIESKRGKPAVPVDVTNNGAGMAMRLAAELVASIIVGLIIGYHLDKWLGTSPFLLVACILFGFVAGVVTMTRSAQAMSQSAEDSENKNR